MALDKAQKPLVASPLLLGKWSGAGAYFPFFWSCGLGVVTLVALLFLSLPSSPTHAVQLTPTSRTTKPLFRTVGPPPQRHPAARLPPLSSDAQGDGETVRDDVLQPEVQLYLALNSAALLVGGVVAFTSPSIMRDIAAGAVASICTMLLGYPLDTAKTRMQIGQKSVGPRGIPGLYKGLGVGLLREATTAAIYIATCGLLKMALVPPDAGATIETVALFLFIGATACLASCTTRVPLEIISKQIQSGQCDSYKEAARRVFFGPEGCNTVERSWIAVLLREVPYGAFQIAFFELAKILFTFLVDLQVPIFFQRMAWGAAAGSCAALLTTPFDVITSRVMIGSGETDGPPPRRSVRETVRQMYQEGGLGTFFTGALLRALFYSPGTCLFFAIYETVAAALV